MGRSRLRQQEQRRAAKTAEPVAYVALARPQRPECVACVDGQDLLDNCHHNRS